MDTLITYWPWFVGAIVLAALAALLRLVVPHRRLPYQKRSRLVTKAELRFYRALLRSAQDDFLVFSMVRVADLLLVPESTPQRRLWLNRIVGKHIDFVLCDPGTLEPKLAIELDDATHQREDRAARDQFLNQAFEAAGLPLLRVAVQESYEAKSLREAIEKRLS
ncbi:MAG TPA: DUF2726 domain-containing protein [Pirellulaceae bacterium]|nr:DUF2726 domain-containing protein [Pirellulaceae bacterium]